MSEDQVSGVSHDLNLLAAYAEDRLTAPERERMTAHLAECRECRGTLALFARGTAAIQPSSTRASRTWDGWLSMAALLAMATVGGLVALRMPDTPMRPSAAPQDPPAAVSAPPAATPPQAPPPSTGTGQVTAPSTPSPGGGTTQEPLRRRSGERQAGGKTFRLIAGDWVDSAYDPFALLPVVDARSATERKALLSRTPALRPYAELGPRVLVVHGGTVYRIGPVEHR